MNQDNTNSDTYVDLSIWLPYDLAEAQDNTYSTNSEFLTKYTSYVNQGYSFPSGVRSSWRYHINHGRPTWCYRWNNVARLCKKN